MALRISRGQLRQMVGGDQTMLLGALERLVRDEHAEVVDGLPRALVDRMLRKGIDAAHQYGLLDAEDVATFVLLMFEFGPEFHRHPAVRDLLTDRARPAHERIQAVARTTPEATWHEIESTLPRQRWF